MPGVESPHGPGIIAETDLIPPIKVVHPAEGRQPDDPSTQYYPTNSYVVSWIARIFSLKNSLSRKP